jgi:hypothetical protein
VVVAVVVAPGLELVVLEVLVVVALEVVVVLLMERLIQVVVVVAALAIRSNQVVADQVSLS